MKRRTIDLMVSAGGLLVAVILLVGGLVLTANANFAKNYVRDQLGAQKITFTALADLSEEEAQTACLREYAGQPLTTGKQAECYANDYIGLHLRTGGGDLAGLTYAELGDVVNERRAVATTAREQLVAAATAAGNVPEAQWATHPALGAQYEAWNTANTAATAASTRRETVFKGESLRGLLLTSYGFSELGVKAGQGATVAYTGSALMFLLAALGLWHGFRTPGTQAFAAPEPAARRERTGANA